jgi:hypothetical protein
MYRNVKNQVANCPALYFITSDGEVVVMTDASDFGIGAYIYQVVDGKERPIIFLSKALHGAQLNWSTIEKEAYAIFYTLKTHDHLLRDIKFTLKTDHKNLTYINLESSQKVRRWKLFLQDFNFQMEHVAGVNNSVADAFSRLCSHQSTAETEEPHESSLFLLQSEESVKIPTNEYRKIGRVHNSRVGHFGAEKTLDMLHEGKARLRTRGRYLGTVLAIARHGATPYLFASKQDGISNSKKIQGLREQLVAVSFRRFPHLDTLMRSFRVLLSINLRLQLL